MANTDSGVKMKSLKRAGLKVETEAFTMAAKKKKKKTYSPRITKQAYDRIV